MTDDTTTRADADASEDVVDTADTVPADVGPTAFDVAVTVGGTPLADLRQRVPGQRRRHPALLLGPVTAASLGLGGAVFHDGRPR